MAGGGMASNEVGVELLDVWNQYCSCPNGIACLAG